jgi:tetratricopeptide (TPR) repeat protein
MTRNAPARPDRISIPVVTADLARMVILRLIILLAAVGVFAAGMALGFWAPLQRVMKNDLLGSLVGFVLSLLFTQFVLAFYALIVRRGVGFDVRTLLRLMQQAEYGRALDAARKHEQTFAANPWLDQMRLLVFLDANAYSYRELALLNQAYFLLKLERVADALAAYRQVLAINSSNSLAADSLALAAAARGEPPLEVSPPMMMGTLYDTGMRRRLAIIGLLLTPILFIPCMLASWWLFSLRYSLGLSLLISIISGVVFALISALIYRFIARRVVLADLYRGRRLAQRGRYEEAAQAYEKQLAFLNDTPHVDEWRARLLLDPTTFGYREMVLMALANAYSHLGDGASVEAVLRRALEINPANGNVWNALEFMRLAREQQETSQEAV